MCGIFFRSSRNPIEIPGWLPESCKYEVSRKFDKTAGVKLTAEDITALISKGLACDVILSEDDRNKLANVGRLRELQEQLNHYKNSQHKQQNREKAESIEAEMSTLVEKRSVSNSASRSVEDIKGPVDPLRCIMARGPDFAQLFNFVHQGNHLQLLSSVLSLRQPFTEQPLVCEEWVLQFNGELYDKESLDGNDTSFIMDQLALELARQNPNKAEAVAATITRLNGEFAYVLLDILDNTVYFGKDCVGKRSLLFEQSDAGLTISSIFPSTSTHALECKGNVMYKADLSTHTVEPTHLRRASPQQMQSNSLEFEAVAVESLSESLHHRLLKACEDRQSTIHPLHPHLKDARLGILFSGGLDCTVLAALLAENFVKRNESCLIDLLTVGFENPRTGLSAASSPDRILSEQSWFELCQLFQGSGVEFRLVQIDVSYAEWLAHRQRVRRLIYPCATEMDLSIAIAFYFAARAENCELLQMNSNIQEISLMEFRLRKGSLVSQQRGYSSQAKVLFSGLGADELFGGYSRHENIFHGLKEDSPSTEVCKKYHELSLSLMYDIDVIYERNLGRDDRAMSSWGKELRYPYLDKDFISWVIREVSLQMKVRFEWGTQKTKKGEKRVMRFERKFILRRLAEKLGLELASKEIKRAIQFGAKSAKMEVGQHKTRGTDEL
ncbi:hypothetical protein METBIDRAFT_79168 [Metschnikowia bicuspidata var. bicuspidata NRRL YB-4993]|uniref:Glutamine amidotransferase type-2 domain-containing protein n=1 Tax=Metschnikowia bicuspidata var. bicuspidata NRRL YB-4993 TaxID=869754 RepID=A0A1A0H7D6_9ASCO|nr:hypothetical protein METBIDRAFT_79168 [Metschnikowia bicuspidata var. bicuspidata NRRL YB-4993]OBA19813.1 hypothetical protein METBIDRAFT_79168 [Metschnikowia bicuspidata var. bicuspidata NRRL YB-4993]